MLVYLTRRLKTFLVTVSNLAFTRGVKTVKPWGLLEKIFPEEFPGNHKSVEQD